MLHRLTHLIPILRDATRWSGLRSMVRRFLRIQPELEEVAATDVVQLDFSATPLFTTQYNTLQMQLREIYTVATPMQCHGATFQDCRYFLASDYRSGSNQQSIGSFVPLQAV